MNWPPINDPGKRGINPSSQALLDTVSFGALQEYCTKREKQIAFSIIETITLAEDSLTVTFDKVKARNLLVTKDDKNLLDLYEAASMLIAGMLSSQNQFVVQYGCMPGDMNRQGVDASKTFSLTASYDKKEKAKFTQAFNDNASALMEQWQKSRTR